MAAAASASKPKARRWGRKEEENSAPPTPAAAAAGAERANAAAATAGTGTAERDRQDFAPVPAPAPAPRLRPNGSRWHGGDAVAEQLRPKGSTRAKLRFEGLGLPGADVSVAENVFSGDESDAYLRLLKRNVDWKRRTIVVDGQAQNENRYTCYYADSADLTYLYSGRVNNACAWLPELLEIKAVVERHVRDTCGLGDWTFNACLLNRYDGEHHSLGFHCDSEIDMVELSPIASVSFGCARRFELKRKDDLAGESLRAVQLTEGSVLVMAGETQRNYLHGVPVCPTNEKGMRINLTFRVMAPRPVAT